MQRISPEHITQAAAAVLTALILWQLFAAPGPPPRQPPLTDPGVRLSLEEAPTPPAPQPEPPKPKPRTLPVQHHPMQPEPEPLIPVPVDPDPPAPDAPVIAADVPAVPAPAGPSHASVEAAYMAALRENINARTALPDTAEYRLLKPQGEALVRFLLDRNGTPGQVALQRTSGSHILDAQALHIVSSGRYPPFPEAAFPGEASHLFVVHVEFH